MNGILQSALGGGRALLVGWILPSAVNVLIFGFVIIPKFSGFGDDATRSAVFGLLGTVLLGLVLAALQTQLYRVLEGYLGWPERLFRAGRRCQLARKHLLRGRLNAATLVLREQPLSEADTATLAEYRAHPVTSRYVDSDAPKGPVWLSLLEERLRRYPIDDRQVTPTRLGNAIRRFEEYGYNHFCLDSQALWHELNAVVPESARKQAEDARTNVDFFVCLLYGHLLVALAALIDLCAGAPKSWPAVVTLLGLLVLSAVWYRVAVAATDDWAGAVRAMVNLGRQPLATSMGLTVPRQLAEERAMWSLTADLASSPYRGDFADLDKYRAGETKS